MKQPKYDIFISYRHGMSSYKFARILQLMFKKKGYKVFFDLDCIDDANFEEQLKCALCNSKVYMVIISEGIFYSEYTRKGVLMANEQNKPIIPVVCDNQYPSGLYSNPNAKEACEILENSQWSEISFDLNLKSYFYMLEKRVRKYATPNLFKRLHYKVRNNVIKYLLKEHYG